MVFTHILLGDKYEIWKNAMLKYRMEHVIQCDGGTCEKWLHSCVLFRSNNNNSYFLSFLGFLSKALMASIIFNTTVGRFRIKEHAAPVILFRIIELTSD